MGIYGISMEIYCISMGNFIFSCPIWFVTALDHVTSSACGEIADFAFKSYINNTKMLDYHREIIYFNLSFLQLVGSEPVKRMKFFAEYDEGGVKNVPSHVHYLNSE